MLFSCEIPVECRLSFFLYVFVDGAEFASFLSISSGDIIGEPLTKGFTILGWR